MTSKEFEDFKNLRDKFAEAKPVNFSEMTILGLLSHQNLSGYDINKLIKARFTDRYGPIFSMTKATVYNTLSRFEEQGLVSVIEIQKQEKKPTRYLYGLTAKGNDYLKNLVMTNMNNPPYMIITPFFSLFFFNVLKKQEVGDLLSFKIHQMETTIKMSKAYVNSLPDGSIKIITTAGINIYKSIIKVLKELEVRLDSEPVKQTYKIETLIENEFFELIERQMKKE